jgi:hypothetical protein
MNKLEMSFYEWWVTSKIRDAYWWVRHRVWPKNRYNMIDTKLPAGYWDPSNRITHGVFELFCAWKESVEETVVWDETEEDIKAWGEFCRAYAYWKELRPIIKEKIDWLWENAPELKMEYIPIEGSPCVEVKFPDFPEKPKWKRMTDEANTLEQDKANMDVEHLQLIIKNIHRIWYP